MTSFAKSSDRLPKINPHHKIDLTYQSGKSRRSMPKRGLNKADAKHRASGEPDPLDTCAPYTESYNYILQQTPRRDKATAIRVVMRMRERGIPMDLRTYNLLLDILADTGDDSPFRVYEDMKEEAAREDSTVAPDLNTYSILIRACERSGAYDKAFQLFHEMKTEFAIDPDVAVYNTLIGFCAAVRDERTASEVFEEMKEKGVRPNVHTYNSLMNVFSEASYEVIQQMFEDMPLKGIQPNLRTFNTIMKACQRYNDYDRAFQFFEELKRQGTRPSVTTYNILIEMCIAKLEAALSIQAQKKASKSSSPTAGGKEKDSQDEIISAIADKSLELFSSMRADGERPNTNTYNAVMTVMARAGDARVFEMFNTMVGNKVGEGMADTQGQGAEENADEATEVEAESPVSTDSPKLKKKVTLDQEDMDPSSPGTTTELSSILTGKAADEGIVKPDLHTYTTLIMASEKMGMYEKALEVFQEMIDVGIRPDKVSYMHMMDVCVLKKDTKRAYELLNEAKSRNILPDVDLYNSLMNVLAESCDKTIFTLFDEMLANSIKPNINTYNILMTACERNKDADKAFKLYNEMLGATSLVKPTLTTYNILMEICGITKDTERVRALLVDMKQRGVPVTIHTYNRIMNVFVRAKDPGAVDLFNAIRKDGPQPNLETFTVLLTYYCQKVETTDQNDETIIALFNEMKKKGLEADLNVFNIMLKYCAAVRDKRKSLKYFEELKHRGLVANIHTYNALMAVFAESGDELIYKVFEEMNENNITANHLTFSILIKHKKGMERLRLAAEQKLLIPAESGGLMLS